MTTSAATQPQQADAAKRQAGPRISAVVCAYNAAAFLRDCIDSIMDQITPAEQYEVLLIDNNSNDRSCDVIRDLKEAYGNRLKVLTELRPGLSAARNLALAEADSDLIAFVDADAIVAAWLPTTHAEYMERVGDNTEDLGPNLDGTKLGLVVPEYTDVDSIADLNDNADSLFLW
ncbi:MAG: glycosyltransferase, partial [Planctomycetes bacterium]|nr:glycosyltransferase [Planctomycetota bacterium]